MDSGFRDWVAVSRDRETKFARFLVTGLPEIFRARDIAMRVLDSNYSGGCTYPVVRISVPGVATVVLRNNNYAVLLSARLEFTPEDRSFIRVIPSDAENSRRPAHYWFDGVPDDWQYDRLTYCRSLAQFSELLEPSFGPQDPLPSFFLWLSQQIR